MVRFDMMWPIYIEDNQGHSIYLTAERWDHALDHPGMSDDLLDALLDTLQFGQRKRDAFDPRKSKYSYQLHDLPINYTHMVAVVKFGWQGDPPTANNFVLTAYLIEKW